MNLFNTLSRQIEEIKPLNPPAVTVYTCGPTVYDHAHIGHWFTYIRMDILVRTLKANKLNPKWVMNITDVGHLVSDADEGEDKLEKGAKREGKTAWEIARFYEEEFVADMTRLNILKPDFMPRATDHIDDQIALIQTLEDKGYTYRISDGLYFDSSQFPSYADFARLDLDEQQPGKRVELNPEKKHSSDFALWKFSPSDHQRDMEWDSPWGKGFPGWHIECSAIAMRFLGETIDIHCGGIDHIPVHHTNEIAQSQSATGKPLANYWMHSNHIMVSGQKISKSLGNSITLTELENRGFSPEALRLLVLESHYRSQSKFGWDTLESASQRLSELKAMAVLRYQAKNKTTEYKDRDVVSLSDVTLKVQELLNDDLNTPGVLAYLSKVSTQLLSLSLDPDSLDQFNNMLKELDQLLGLKLTSVPDIDEDSRSLIKKREEYRLKGQWSEADKIRDDLITRMIAVEDKPSGPQWRWIHDERLSQTVDQK